MDNYLDIEQESVLRKESENGDRMQEFIASPHYNTLMELVIEPLEKGAFNAFKKVNPEKFMEVAQTQIMAKIVDKIVSEMHSIIQRGEHAKATLRDLYNEE